MNSVWPIIQLFLKWDVQEAGVETDYDKVFANIKQFYVRSGLFIGHIQVFSRQPELI